MKLQAKHFLYIQYIPYLYTINVQLSTEMDTHFAPKDISSDGGTNFHDDDQREKDRELERE